jgi:hypothetical protein
MVMRVSHDPREATRAQPPEDAVERSARQIAATGRYHARIKRNKLADSICQQKRKNALAS